MSEKSQKAAKEEVAKLPHEQSEQKSNELESTPEEVAAQGEVVRKLKMDGAKKGDKALDDAIAHLVALKARSPGVCVVGCWWDVGIPARLWSYLVCSHLSGTL